MGIFGKDVGEGRTRVNSGGTGDGGAPERGCDEAWKGDGASAAVPLHRARPAEAGFGERIGGKYELRRLIGSGAMGAVYEGVHIELGKRLAVKVIRPEFCDSAEVIGRFRREARAASAVESEHIAQIFDFGRDDALGLYMVIEYLEGEDLETRLTRGPRVDVAEAVGIGWQVARGLSRAHAVGVIHRDLKPANVFLSARDDGSSLVKILDFGISKLDATKWASSNPDGAAEPTLTRFGTTLGTPQYMSPEQCEGRTEIDERTDVWSLCVVLYEMLAGEPPFPASVADDAGVPDWVGLMRRIIAGDFCPLAKRAPWVPRGIATIVDAGLVRDARARIAGASLVADRLLAACPGAVVQPVLAARGRATATAQADEGAPPSSAEDRVEVFVRVGELPIPIPKNRQPGPEGA
jgi:eukaryotic-like serine/threonine-protein kinase